MNKLIAELCDILEVAVLPLDERFEDLTQWDSLNALSVIALLDSNYGIQMEEVSLRRFASIKEFVQYVHDSRK
jgi:acyl carrier protein